MPPSKYVLDEAAHDFFQTCSRRERLTLLKAFAYLRDHPDALVREVRIIRVLRLGRDGEA